jgi:hypothetical protein
MRSILRKCAIGAVAVGGLLLVQPGNFANAAGNGANKTPREQAVKCVNANLRARNAATVQFHKDIKAARALAADQQQAAVQAAETKFTQAAQTAKDAYTACINAIQTS